MTTSCVRVRIRSRTRMPANGNGSWSVTANLVPPTAPLRRSRAHRAGTRVSTRRDGSIASWSNRHPGLVDTICVSRPTIAQVHSQAQGRGRNVPVARVPRRGVRSNHEPRPGLPPVRRTRQSRSSPASMPLGRFRIAVKHGAAAGADVPQNLNRRWPGEMAER